MDNQQMMDDDMIGAIKIKDGLFIGDSFAAKDLEFVVANKVSRVVNCCGRQVQNQWTNIGVEYLTYTWLDEENQILFDSTDKTTNEIYNFIQDAMNQYESVLVHSVRGQSRASCVIASYMMRHYRWSLLKTLEFLNSRRPDLEIRATFIKQLSQYENRLKAKGLGPQTSKWDEISEENKYLESEELMLRNTFLNAQSGPVTQLGPGALTSNYPTRQRLLKWRDMVTDHNSKQKGQRGYSANIPRLSLALMTEPRRDLVNQQAVKPQVNHHRSQHITAVRPIIRKARSINDISNIYVSMYQRKGSTPMNYESKSFRNDRDSHHQLPNNESSASKKQLNARGQNAQDSQIRGYNNNQNNNAIYKNDKGQYQPNVNPRDKGDTSPITRDNPGGPGPNLQQQSYQRFQHQNAQRSAIARQSNHTPQNLSQIFHPKQQNMDKPTNLGNERSPTEASISEHIQMGSQMQSSAKSSQRNEGQKYINVLPRSNPTGTISSIQDRFNAGSNSLHASQKAGTQQSQQMSGSLNTHHSQLNTSQSQSNGPPFQLSSQIQGQGQSNPATAGNQSMNPQIRSQGQAQGLLHNQNAFDANGNNNYINAAPGPSQHSAQAPEKGAENSNAAHQSDMMRKPYSHFDHRSDPSQSDSKYQGNGQHNQPLGSGPQYITNIYNTINTNSITTHQDQIYQFMGPAPYAGQPQALAGMNQGSGLQVHQGNPNMNQSQPIQQLQPSLQPPGSEQSLPLPSNQNQGRPIAGNVRSPQQDMQLRNGMESAGQQRQMHLNDSLYNQNRQNFGNEESKTNNDARSLDQRNDRFNLQPDQQRTKRLENDQKSDRGREYVHGNSEYSNLVYDQHNNMIQSFDDRKQQEQQDRLARDVNADQTVHNSQYPDMSQSLINSRDNPSSSHTNLNVSNLSNVQKELRPNKIVNKGNSVFQNHHKLIQNGKNMPIKAMQQYDNNMHPMHQNMAAYQKLNAHQINRQGGQKQSKGGSNAIQVLHNVKNVRMSVRESIQSQITNGATKGPTIGSKSENLVHNGDNQAVNSSGITSASAHSKKAGVSQKFSKDSVKYAKDKGPGRDGSNQQVSSVPKRGGSARPVQDKQNGIIMGSSHGITSQVPPKDGGKAGSQNFSSKSKTNRGESPIVKPTNQLLLTNSEQSKNNTHHTMIIKQNQFHPSGHQYVGGSGPPSAKGLDNKLKNDINLNNDKKPNSGRAAIGMSNSNSYGAVMARGGNLQQATSPLTINFIKMGNGQQQLGGPSASTNKHHIGFKTDRVPNQTFKSGGPIRATGAALENMDKTDIIHSSGAQFEKHQSKQSLTPGSLGSSKMPQRPGSSKPPQKGNLLDNDPSFSSKRPDSPSQKKQGQQTKHMVVNKGRLRSASPNTQMMQQNQSRTGSGNPRSDSAKNSLRKNSGPGAVNQGYLNNSGANPQNTSSASGPGGMAMSMKGKARMNKLGEGGVPGTMIAGSKGLNAKALQQNYMRGYSPSKPLWK